MSNCIDPVFGGKHQYYVTVWSKATGYWAPIHDEEVGASSKEHATKLTLEWATREGLTGKIRIRIRKIY